MPLDDVKLGFPVWQHAEDDGNPLLPIETCEHIMYYLARDLDSLNACLHTCRSFFPRSKFLLENLETFRLHSAVDASNLAASIRSFPRQAHYITWLIVSESSHESDTQTSSFWLHSVPLKLAYLLPRLQLLTLENFQFPLYTHSNFHSHLSLFKTITNLCLYSCRFSSFRELAHLMLAFHYPYGLRLDAVTWEIHGPGQDIFSQSYLQKLHVDDIQFYSDERNEGCFSDLVEWLETGSLGVSLKKLEVRPFFNLADWEAVGRLLSIAPYLNSLCIFLDCLPLSSKLESLHLERASNLETIDITVIPFHLFSSLVDELSHLASSHLKKLHLRFTKVEKNQSYTQSEAWKLMDELLTGANFLELKKVKVYFLYTVYGEIDTEVEEKEIEKLLPALYAKDIIEFWIRE